MKNNSFICICILFKIITVLSSGNNVTQLQKYLFKDYNVNVRPASKYSSPVVVTIGLSLKKIQNLDEILQSFKATVNLHLYWRDEMLTWNESEFDGISVIVFPYEKNIWIPDLLVHNALSTPEKVGFKDNYVRLYSNGQVFFWTQTNTNTACEIMTKKFPLDEQFCKIDIGKFISEDAIVELVSLQNWIKMDQYVEIAEWNVIETYVTSRIIPFEVYSNILNNKSFIDMMNFTVISFSIKMKRSCRSCFINIVMPVVVLAVLNLLSFFVPCESGEKTSYPIAIFLTLAVFLTMITQSLPESVDGVSYLSSFVAFQLLASAVTLLSAVFSLQLHNKTTDGKENFLEIQENAESTVRCRQWKTFDRCMFLFLLICELIAVTVFLIYILS